jgi:hypothetical protein
MHMIIALGLLIGLAGSTFAGNPPEVDKKGNQEETEKGMTDISKALTEARAIPHFENGKPAGYRRVPAQANGNYEMLTLKNGDMITAPDPDYVPPVETVEPPKKERVQ